MTDDEKAKVIDVLCGQALADHLGDVRDAEEGLWELLGAPKPEWDDPAWDDESAWRNTKTRLERAGYSLPDYLQGTDDAADE